MAKLAILFLTAVAFQAAFAGVPRFFTGDTLMTHWDFDTVNTKEMIMHVDMFFKNFFEHLEYKVMDRDMILCCIQKFIRFIDVLCMKLEGTDHKIFLDCVMMCKTIKVKCEKMLMYTDVHEMKMMFVECLRMFCMEFKKWCMYEEFCMKVMHKDIFMHLRMMMDDCIHTRFTDVVGYHKNYFMHFDVMYKKLITFCETTDVSKDVLMVYMRKFMMVLDYTLEKVCFGGKCNGVMMREICMELKNIKVMIERCLSYGMFTDVYKMKMECCECIKMFYKCMKMLMTCEDCCVGFDMVFNDIYMRFMTFCETVWGRTFTTGMVYHDNYFVGDYTHYKDLKVHLHMWYKRFIEFCKHTDLTKDTLIVCIRKFITVCDYCIEKLCFEGKCNNVIVHEICTELKHIKMMLERCLTYDFIKMKTECVECCKLFFRCVEKLTMCDDCCVGFDVICRDICMCFIDFCKTMMGGMDFHMLGGMRHMYYGDIHMLVTKFLEHFESGVVTKDMMMMCVRKFLVLIDYTIEKLCYGDRCKDTVLVEICMELRRCKMMLERCLTYGTLTDFHKMKMECVECIRMFFRCMERLVKCDNCCVGFDLIWKEICMRFETIYHFMFYRMNTYGMDMYKHRDFTTMYRGFNTGHMMPYFYRHFMKY